eukprot:319753_1
MESCSISNVHTVEGDLIWPSSFSTILSNNESGLLIQSNCSRTEYPCGPPPCVQLRLTVEGYRITKLGLSHLVPITVTVKDTVALTNFITKVNINEIIFT